MSEYRVTVRITPRQGLLDPEGKAVGGALHSLGFEGVRDVRVGRLVSLTLEAESDAQAHARVRSMCEKLLANPVTEDFVVELAGDPRPTAAAEGRG